LKLHFKRYLNTTSIVIIMGGDGDVLFEAGAPYDPDVWDDSSLIRAYDRAMESSRKELDRRKKEGSRHKKTWEMGAACRVVYSQDGEEYEATVVASNPANRAVTVRFLGYNNEEEVKTRDVMESLGQEAREEQVEEAEMNKEEEEEKHDEDWKVGDWCRGVYEVDGRVYEGVIENMNSKRATVRFLGYDNKQKIPLEQLTKSKGEERRTDQESQALLDKQWEEVSDDLGDEELEKMIERNCPDIMATFGSLPGEPVAASVIDNLDKTEEKHKKKEKKHKKEKKEKKNKKDKISTASSQSSLPSISQGPPFQPGNLPPMPEFNQILPPAPPTLPPPFSSMPSMPPAFPMFHSPSQPLYSAPSFPGVPPPPPVMTPQADPASHANAEALYSLLSSWYIAGYQTGLYQGQSGSGQPPGSRIGERKKHKKKKHKDDNVSD